MAVSLQITNCIQFDNGEAGQCGDLRYYGMAELQAIEIYAVRRSMYSARHRDLSILSQSYGTLCSYAE